MNFMKPSNQPPLTATTAASGIYNVAPIFRWGVTDGDLHNGVHFVTETKVYGDAIRNLPAAALYRMVCFYLIGCLEESALKEACEALADMYSWQHESENLIPTPRGETYFVPSSHLTETDRTPFVFD